MSSILAKLKSQREKINVRIQLLELKKILRHRKKITIRKDCIGGFVIDKKQSKSDLENWHLEVKIKLKR